MNIHRYIAGLLFTCFSAFLGHNLVPHHHLSEDLFTPLAASCPIEQGDQQGRDHHCDSDTKKDQHPTHCHAFNDVVFEKFNSAVYNPQPSQIQEMVGPEQGYDPDILLPLTTSLNTFPEMSSSPRAGRGIRALRAPPLFG